LGQKKFSQRKLDSGTTVINKNHHTIPTKTMMSSTTMHALVVVCSTLLWSMAFVTTVQASSRRAGLLRIADLGPSSLKRTVTEAGDLATTVGKGVQHGAPFPEEQQQPSDDQRELWNEDFEM
jgi:hypothetical protein